jgi:hypothetical protein
MRGEEAGGPKLMFVVTAAFGELFAAMYMVMGCGFRTAFAMPEPFYSLNREGLPGTCHRFDNLASLLVAIEQENPDLVCLFSGYLFAKDEIVSLDELDRLVKYLQIRRTKAITSDPFLGLISRLPPLDLDNPIAQILGLPIRLMGEAMLGSLFPYLLRTRIILQDIPHVYIVDPHEHVVKTLAFYNPHMRHYASDLAATPISGVPAQPYWLFVLGASDYYPQIKRYGAEYFHAVVAQKLADTMQQGRRAVLIAPASCIAALEQHAALQECVFVQNCDYQRYMAILLGAEYAFYWNIFSASLSARLFNRLPIFFFSVGHLGDENPLMLGKGMRCYYNNAPLNYIQPGDRLSAAALSSAAAAQQTQLFDAFFNNVQHLPTPEAVVRDLLAEH